MTLQRITHSLLACIFCIPELPPTPPNTPIPYAVEVDVSGLPRNDSDYSMGPIFLERMRELELENALLKENADRLHRRIEELETALTEW